MTSITSFLNLPSPLLHSSSQFPHFHPSTPTILALSFSPRRRRRRPPRRNDRKHKPSSSDDSGNLQFILDVEQLKNTAPVSFLQRSLTYCESKLEGFLLSGSEAYNDVRNMVSVEPGSNRVVVSCKESTVWFIGGVVIWSCVFGVFVRVLVGLGLGFSGRDRGRRMKVITRRDRSLGGKEVVVATTDFDVGQRRKAVRSNETGSMVVPRVSRQKEERKLPNWWPVSVPNQVLGMNKDEYQREASKLIQEILDDKLSGKDISEDDIIDLRRICRKSGVRLSFPTENARDSLYRSSVHYAISTCSKAQSPVEIDGEDARVFLAGLAYNFGLTALRAATIVSAAVAAQTRQWFLQAWALEMQAKHSEATEELKKICVTHQIFPPEPSSPEMEMVGRGLERHLKVEQREFLLNKLVDICGEDSRRTAMEALGLV